MPPCRQTNAGSSSVEVLIATTGRSPRVPQMHPPCYTRRVWELCRSRKLTAAGPPWCVLGRRQLAPCLSVLHALLLASLPEVSPQGAHGGMVGRARVCTASTQLVDCVLSHCVVSGCFCNSLHLRGSPVRTPCRGQPGALLCMWGWAVVGGCACRWIPCGCFGCARRLPQSKEWVTWLGAPGRIASLVYHLCQPGHQDRGF